MKGLSKRLCGAVLAVLVMLWSCVALAGPEGHYNVTGTVPGGSDEYNGTVCVTAKANTYHVEWRIGTTSFTGIGIFTNSNFSVAYYGTNLTGVAVYQEQSDGVWNGVWAVKDQGRLGTEVWTPR